MESAIMQCYSIDDCPIGYLCIDAICVMRQVYCEQCTRDIYACTHICPEYFARRNQTFALTTTPKVLTISNDDVQPDSQYLYCLLAFLTGILCTVVCLLVGIVIYRLYSQKRRPFLDTLAKTQANGIDKTTEWLLNQGDNAINYVPVSKEDVSTNKNINTVDRTLANSQPCYKLPSNGDAGYVSSQSRDEVMLTLHDRSAEYHVTNESQPSVTRSPTPIEHEDSTIKVQEGSFASGGNSRENYAMPFRDDEGPLSVYCHSCSESNPSTYEVALRSRTFQRTQERDGEGCQEVANPDASRPSINFCITCGQSLR